MIRQIALTLLALFLTLPAAAAPLCHQPVVQSAADHAGMDHAAMGHDAPDPVDEERRMAPGAQHGCLGCAAPVAPPPVFIATPLPPLATPDARVATLTGIALAPALPPPRS